MDGEGTPLVRQMVQVFFANIKYRNELNNTLNPERTHYNIIMDSLKCYELSYAGNDDDELRFNFQFGGPGGQCAN